MTHTDEDRPIQVQSIAVIIQRATSCDDDDAIKAAYTIWDYTGHPKCTGKDEPRREEIEAAAKAIVGNMYFAPHELPVDGNLWRLYRQAARDALVAALSTRPAPEDDSPGTPLARLKGIADFAIANGLCAGIEAKPPELFLMEAFERLGEIEAIINADTKAWGEHLRITSYCHKKCLMPKLRAALAALPSQPTR